MLVVFAIYMATTIYKGFKNPAQQEPEEDAQNESLLKNLIVLIISSALIAVGADMLEGSSVSMATMAGIPTEVVGVTVVALCTSIPELVTAITALVKGHAALSFGNIIGANIFNLVLVSGAAVTISPFEIPDGSKLFGYNTSQLIEIPLMVTVMALMTLPALFKGKLRRWQGVTLLGIYVAFVVLQVLIALKVV
jgi:cation:H+ antiporter